MAFGISVPDRQLSTNRRLALSTGDKAVRNLMGCIGPVSAGPVPETLSSSRPMRAGSCIFRSTVSWMISPSRINPRSLRVAAVGERPDGAFQLLRR